LEPEDKLSSEKARHLRDQFREARLVALRDAEAFHEILYTLERLGYLLKGEEGNLWEYKAKIEVEARDSALAVEIPIEHREWHTPFSDLYDLVRIGRNDALHQGAFARNLTMHATQLALVLEDALTDKATTIGDFMVRGPICALPWQPVSFVRQQMLANSFSYLPMQWETKQGIDWKLVSDFHVARYLRIPDNPGGNERKRRLAKTVQDAVGKGSLVLEEATSCSSRMTVEEALPLFSGDGRPLLVHHPDDPGRLMGIVTAYDLL
jgi:CBS domain-containing protein